MSAERSLRGDTGRPWTAHVEEQQRRACEILTRMGPEHWEALEYMFKTGKRSSTLGADTDLMEWGAIRFITKDQMFVSLTDAGLIVLESKEW